MYTLSVARTFPAPIADVFDAYTDHAAMAEIPGVRSARVVRPGDRDPNGLGAIREIDLGLVWLREEIVGFDRPNRMEYHILKSRPPADHHFGRVDFAEAAEGTVVTWTTVFSLPLPVVGKLAEVASGIVFGLAFRVTLRSVAQRVQRSRVAG